jgi:hypothetical protein
LPVSIKTLAPKVDGNLSEQPSVDSVVFLELAFEEVERLVWILWFEYGIDTKSNLLDFDGVEIVDSGHSRILPDQFKK